MTLVNVAIAHRLVALEAEVEHRVGTSSAIREDMEVSGSEFPNDEITPRVTQIVAWNRPVAVFERDR